MMSVRNKKERGRKPGRLLIGGLTGVLMGAGVAGAAALPLAAPAGAATTTSPSVFSIFGTVFVVGDAQDNAITISRDVAGKIFVNGRDIQGGRVTVANTKAMVVAGLAGNDTISLDETNGVLPRADLFGGIGNDSLTGGSGDDRVVGQGGNDDLFGKGGVDVLVGNAGNDTLTGGTQDDQAFGGAGDDRMIWNPGEGTDLNEGGEGNDTTEVNGGNGAERFQAAENGSRVRFDRVDPAPFSIDIGTTENLVLNANGGDDSFSTTGNLAALIKITVDGGAGNDNIVGSNGVDTLLGGDGNDFIDGQQGNDIGLLGNGDDTFQWDPGDGSDTIEGQQGADTMRFNGAGAAENFDTSANGGRVRFFRDVANITMDLDDVEKIDLNALGGADTAVVNDLSGTDLKEIKTDLALTAGSGTDDGAVDNVIVNATNGDDVAVVSGQGSDLQVVGLATTVSVTGAKPGSDRLTVNALGGDDVVDASGVAAGSPLLVIDGGAGDDVLIGGEGDDNISGGAGDDVLLGGPGFDTLAGGPGDDILIDGEVVTDGLVAGQQWVDDHARVVNGQTVVDHDQKSYTLPAADLT